MTEKPIGKQRMLPTAKLSSSNPVWATKTKQDDIWRQCVRISSLDRDRGEKMFVERTISSTWSLSARRRDPSKRNRDSKASVVQLLPRCVLLVGPTLRVRHPSIRHPSSRTSWYLLGTIS